MTIKSSSIILFSLLITTPISIFSMEELEDNKKQDPRPTFPAARALTYYKYQSTDITSEETEEYELPFTYSIPKQQAGGFTLPDGYLGKVTIADIKNCTCIGLLHCLMKNNDQPFSIIHTHNAEPFCKLFKHIFEEKVLPHKKALAAVTLQLWYCNHEDYAPILQTVKPQLLMLPIESSASTIRKLNLAEEISFTCFINTDPQQSCAFFGRVNPQYFLPKGNHHSDPRIWIWCNLF